MTDPDDKTKRIDRLPGLRGSSGEQQATAVKKLLDDWKITCHVCGMVFDTTRSNTGKDNGACRLLEKKLDKDLLNLACRHHIYEIILREAFKTSFGGTSGPDVLQFNRFQDNWTNINATKFNSCFDDPQMDPASLRLINDEKEEILKFVKKRMQVGSKHCFLCKCMVIGY